MGLAFEKKITEKQSEPHAAGCVCVWGGAFLGESKTT